MISNSDFEKAWFLYKTEYEPKNISINSFCIRTGLSYTEFNKWFRKTHHHIVPLEVDGAPCESSADPGPDVSQVHSSSEKRCKGGIHVIIRTRDGLQVQKKGISYQSLVTLVEKLEGLC